MPGKLSIIVDGWVHWDETGEKLLKYFNVKRPKVAMIFTDSHMSLSRFTTWVEKSALNGSVNGKCFEVPGLGLRTGHYTFYENRLFPRMKVIRRKLFNAGFYTVWDDCLEQAFSLIN